MLDLNLCTPKVRTIAGANIRGNWYRDGGSRAGNVDAKLFSPLRTKFGAEPNNNVSFWMRPCLASCPPSMNSVVEQAVRTGLGPQAEINLHSAFDRKKLLLPRSYRQGYQIFELFYHPIVAAEGEVLVEDGGGVAGENPTARLCCVGNASTWNRDAEQIDFTIWTQHVLLWS